MEIEAYRPYLFGIAYRMLGTAMEAEDVLQEAYLRARDVDEGTIHFPKAYLAKMVTRLCLDHLKSAREQREVYPGIWMPEPIVTADVQQAAADESPIDSLSFAMLILLEQLSPAERAVFVLREVFDYEYAEIAGMLDKDEAACRQLFHRAKTHLRQNRPRFPSSSAAQQQLLMRFLGAAQAGDLEGLTRMLAEDVVSWSDGGGKVAAAVRPIYGAAAVARFIIGLVKRGRELNVTFEMRPINHQYGMVTRLNGQVINVMLLDLDDDRVHRVMFIANPDKLRLPDLPIE